jgi:hypothetical protein
MIDLTEESDDDDEFDVIDLSQEMDNSDESNGTMKDIPRNAHTGEKRSFDEYTHGTSHENPQGSVFSGQLFKPQRR